MLKVNLDGLAGFNARDYSGPVDHEAMCDLTNRWLEATELHERQSVAGMDNYYKTINPECCNLVTDMVMIESPGGHLAGYIRTEWSPTINEPTRFWVVPHIDPDHRSTPLARRLIDAGIRRCLELAPDVDAANGQVLESWTNQGTEQDISAIYTELGFEVVTYGVTMTRSLVGDLPTADLPDSVEIRPVTEDQLRQIWEADQLAFRDHWGWTEPTEHEYQRFLDFPHRDISLWKIAWRGDQVVGQVKSFIKEDENKALDQQRGYTEFISTSPGWRKQGVASALICASFQALKDQGMTEAALGVHAENPTGAFGLYESLGFEMEHTFLTWQRVIR